MKRKMFFLLLGITVFCFCLLLYIYVSNSQSYTILFGMAKKIHNRSGRLILFFLFLRINGTVNSEETL